MKYPESESHTLEFKASVPKSDQIIKTIIAFCNQGGGRLIIGIADDGTILGINEDEIMMLMDWVEKAIYEASSPPILAKVMTQRIMNKSLLVVKVSPGMNKPYFRQSEGVERGTYIRAGKSTLRATREMIEELKWQSIGQSYDVMPVYQASVNELDHKKISAFLKARKNIGEIIVTEEIIKNFKLTIEEHLRVYPTVNGILNFGTNVEYWFPEAMIICTHFSGISGREAIATRDLTGPLFEQFQGAYEFVLSRLNRSFTIQGPIRKEKLEVPPVAIRELILNAIIHRNYHLRAPSKIAIYDDRIEIFSPGSFPTPFSNLRLGLADVRNMAICKIFREAQLIEKLGTGFLTVFDSYEKWGLPEPVVINGENYVKCILPRQTTGERIKVDPLIEILNLFETADELAVSNVIECLRLPRASASRYLRELVNSGKLVKIGQGKGTRYQKPPLTL